MLHVQIVHRQSFHAHPWLAPACVLTTSCKPQCYRTQRMLHVISAATPTVAPSPKGQSACLTDCAMLGLRSRATVPHPDGHYGLQQLRACTERAATAMVNTWHGCWSQPWSSGLCRSMLTMPHKAATLCSSSKDLESPLSPKWAWNGGQVQAAAAMQ